MAVFDASSAGRLLFIAWLFAPAVVALVAMAVLERRPGVCVRRFWCGVAGRDVQVTFVGTIVRSCTAFEPADAITCRRGCRHAGALRSEAAA